MNTDWWFCFEYFPTDVKPANIEYRKLPKNREEFYRLVKDNFQDEGDIFEKEIEDFCKRYKFTPTKIIGIN